ncbi:hypothetical protein STCU_09958 [Strigomonas culicis]|uniref:Uncharacterized protein n=1 Tax=Strigomonas culicis TaxID=28005 RepID=S9TPR7_9TRYP|nr:hypothetical protein STCU_09958 [Strigomonas culicis]|eukprot:EPY18463.1 hypothetical protein STCU_09958 [Strigomonas culicis]
MQQQMMQQQMMQQQMMQQQMMQQQMMQQQAMQQQGMQPQGVQQQTPNPNMWNQGGMNNMDPFMMGQVPFPFGPQFTQGITSFNQDGVPTGGPWGFYNNGAMPDGMPGAEPDAEAPKEETLTSEELHRSSLPKKKTDLDSMVDGVVDGVKTLKRKVSTRVISMFASDKKDESP